MYLVRVPVFLACHKRDGRQNKAGFSLVELAVSIFLLGLLTSGGVLLFTVWENQRKRVETWEHMHEVKRALMIFARVNKRLPFPAKNGDGEEAVDWYGLGYLPYKTLGVSPTDAWGRQLHYGKSLDVDTSCTALLTHFTPTYTYTSDYYLKIPNTYGGHFKVHYREMDTASYVPAVIVSGGGRDADGAGKLLPGYGFQQAPETPEVVFDALGMYGNYLLGNSYLLASAPVAGFDDLTMALDPADLFYQLGCNTVYYPAVTPLTPPAP